jgi:signal transduction histidine kinase
VLGAVSILAFTLDPWSHGKHAWFGSIALLLYTAYAVVAAIRAWTANAFTRWWPLVSHGLDLGSALILVRFTEGSTSPFFVYLLFPLFPAALRWRWRGTLWTGLLVLIGFVGIGVQDVMVLHDPDFQLNTMLLRTVYIFVLAIILGSVEIYEEQSRRAIVKIATWAGPVTTDEDEFFTNLLDHVADSLEAPRVVLFWRERGAAETNVVEWAADDVRVSTDDMSTWRSALAQEIRDTHFLCDDAGAALPKVLYTSPTGLERWRGAPVSYTLRTRFSMRSLLSLRLHASGVAGRLFVLDKRHLTGDDLMLGALVAQQVESSLEHRCTLERLRDVAATEERVRVARDVHDDVLQSMTALSLGLETVARLIERTPARAREWLAELQSRLGNDQRSLRTAVGGLKRRGAAPSQVAVQLSELVAELEQEWGLPVKLNLQLRGVTVPDSIGHEIRQIVREAVVNAARHARASGVSVDVRGGHNEALITVTDDGRGFPFHGHYDDADRRRLRVGPVVLAERVEALGGSLAIESSNAGARLDIRIPLV